MPIIPKFNRVFYTSLTLISAILLGGLGKLSKSNNNTALAQENIPVSDTCADVYGLLDNFILYGVSQVNWGAIAP